MTPLTNTGTCIYIPDFVPLACDSVHEEEGCYREPGCSWEAHTGACYEEGAAVDCGRCDGEEVCIMTAGCVWTIEATRCHSEDVVLGCAAFPLEKTCDARQDRCYWDPDPGKNVMRCNLIYLRLCEKRICMCQEINSVFGMMIGGSLTNH